MAVPITSGDISGDDGDLSRQPQDAAQGDRRRGSLRQSAGGDGQARAQRLQHDRHDVEMSATTSSV
jgi:hypothetical protein